MNSPKQLDSSQIQYLIDYTKQHHIKYDDLRFELVDHLASGVEEIMAKNSDISFNRALYDFTGCLPIDFFYKFTLEKSKALSQFWRTKFAFYLLSFFTIPRCLITILLFLGLYNTFSFLDYNNNIKVYAIVIIIMVFTFLKNRKHKYRNLSNYLIIESFRNGESILYVTFFALPLWISSQTFNLLIESKIGIIILSAIMTLNIIYTYASNFVFPKMLRQDINKKYAHLNLTLA